MLKKIVNKTRYWYGRWERPVSSISLVGGFVFDALALQRVDTFWENFWIVVHLLVVAVFIILVNIKENTGGDETNPSKAHFWFVNILQFFFGGLLSAYLVFYFRSSDIAVSWPFLLVLSVAFWANESLKRHYARLTFQISLFFLSIFSFAIFLLPIVLHSIGRGIFILSGLLSIFLIIGFVYLIYKISPRKIRKSKRSLTLSILIIFVSINVLYFTKLIPPIPLSIKDGDIYHSILRTSDGNYLVGYENLGWKRYLELYPDTHILPGDTVFAYSAIFSPTSLNTKIIHIWQKYDGVSKTWQTQGTADLAVIGGREGGFRTYSARDNLSAGRWRVLIETPRGEIIGRVRFDVVIVSSEPKISYKVNY